VSDLTIAAVGDLVVLRADAASIFTHVKPVLDQADIVFGHVETPLTDLGEPGSSGPRGAAPRAPGALSAIADNFDVVSMAGNHMFDWGTNAVIDTIERFHGAGVAVVGVGRNVSEARAVSVIERKGVRVGFLGFCSVAPAGYYASANRPGVAPMRAITHYEPFEDDQPGTPPIVMTWPVKADLENLEEAVGEARAVSDVVVCSVHWGVHDLRAVIADYQRTVGQAAIDAGADVVLGHHQHVMKGVEVYNGKAIFHGLGDFAKDRIGKPHLAHLNHDWLREKARVYGSAVSATNELGIDRGGESRYTMIAQCRVGEAGVTAVSYVPAIINEISEPVPLDPASAQGAQVVEYVTAITREAGLDTTRYTVNQDHVAVGGIS
jgi:poly-gamma-glutamate synthesis protein (capsule biosynthesis protein)